MRTDPGYWHKWGMLFYELFREAKDPIRKGEILDAQGLALDLQLHFTEHHIFNITEGRRQA